MEYLPLNRLQKRLLRVQLVLFLLSLPGLYAYTELQPRGHTGSGSVRPLPLRPYDAALKVEPPPRPDPDELAVTPFRLRKLSPEEKRKVQMRLRVDVNRADTERLQTIRGVGPVTAGKIRRYRDRTGGFDSARELKRIDGVGPVTLREMIHQIKLGERLPETPPPLPEAATDTPLRAGERIDVNTAGSRRLQRLPGVGPVIAKRIIRFRRRLGQFRGLEELQTVKGIGPKTLADLRPFLRLSSSGQKDEPAPESTEKHDR